MSLEKFHIENNHKIINSKEDIEKLNQSPNERNCKKIVITGGTEGIGKEIASEFVNHDDLVAICARTQSKIDEIKNIYPNIIAERVDLGDRYMAKNFIKEAIKDLGGLDLLILNAAIFDFQFKSSGLNKETINKQMFDVNEVANVELIKDAKNELKKTNGTIVFMTTRFGVIEDLETASALINNSKSVQEDIGIYIKNKKRINEYLKKFIKDKNNEGIFVFSVIPGTVDTPANRELIEVGTVEMSDAKIKERQDGKERDSKIVGLIISKMATTRKKFNPETLRYDIDIQNGEIVEISNAVVEFEQKQKIV